MRQKRLIPFEITGMDSLGQGVSKLDGKVSFVAKTVPGDKGQAEVLNERKGVTFAKVNTLTSSSPLRCQPECIHFDTCPSCHYLHVDYEQELKFKKESFERLFRKLTMPEIEVVPGIRRFGYRNRIQLHYSLKSKLMGMRDPATHNITEIPNCLIGLPEVLKEVRRLYENQTWIKEAPKSSPEGHVEIYWMNDEIKVSWNKPYAEGGFTQVFQEMNEKLKLLLENEWKPEKPTTLLDLFAGNGNLSDKLNYSRRLCVDIYHKNPGLDFFSENLYGPQALRNVSQELKKRDLKIEDLLIDPPRSGLKNLGEWLEHFKPLKFAYVSCDPHTMARDLQGIQNYSIKRAFLIDFFPSTFHFESLMFLERKN